MGEDMSGGGNRVDQLSNHHIKNEFPFQLLILNKDELK